MTAGDAGKDEAGRTPEQAAQDLTAAGTPATAGTASGLAALGSPGGKNIAKSDETNSGIEPDALKPGAKPVGLQTQAAFFTQHGSIPGNSIPSPSGPVPASTIPDEATRNAAIEAARAGAISSRVAGRNGRFRISDEAARRMGPAQLRAVATDRGYDVGEGGRRGILQRFLAEQAEDDTLEDPPEGHHLGIQAGPIEVPVPVAGAATGNPLATPSRPGGLETPAGTLHNTDGSTPVTTTPTPVKKP